MSIRVGVFLMGLVITTIGYVGLFFGRLIQAAVSRQREFLADASAVQLSRNPDGIAGALAMIGGWERGGSRIANRHAETFSHLFFADGLARRLDSLYATHPPLEERINRIRPGFLAARYLQQRAAADATPSGRPEQLDAAVAPLAPARPGSATAAVVASVGKPAVEHVNYAAQLLADLPDPLRAATHTPDGAQALILAFALSDEDDMRVRQLALLERAGPGAVVRRTAALYAEERTLDRAARLPLVTLALPALCTLDQAARDTFVGTLKALIETDQQVTLEEFVLITIVAQQLSRQAGRAVAIRYRSILEVGEEAALVLSLLAHAGENTPADAGPAFDKGVAAAGLRGRVSLLPMEAIAFAAVGGALQRLRLLAPLAKGAFIEACVETIEADGRILLAEAEVLRAVASALDCPVPPILNATRPE